MSNWIIRWVEEALEYRRKMGISCLTRYCTANRTKQDCTTSSTKDCTTSSTKEGAYDKHKATPHCLLVASFFFLLEGTEPWSYSSSCLTNTAITIYPQNIQAPITTSLLSPSHHSTCHPNSSSATSRVSSPLIPPSPAASSLSSPPNAPSDSGACQTASRTRDRRRL